MKWSEENTLKFLQCYREQECLWNTKHQCYTSKTFRDIAYAKIAQRMALPELDVRAVKVKIKNLRAHYFTELKKVRYAAAFGKPYEPSLYWYREIDCFLREAIKDIPSLQQPEVITGDSIYDSSCIYESGVGELDEDSMGKASPIFHMGDTSTPGTSTPPQNPYLPGTNNTNKRKKRTYTKRNKEQLEEDEFEVFGKSVAAQLRRLSISRALNAQTRIQTVLTEERLQDLETVQSSHNEEVQQLPLLPHLASATPPELEFEPPVTNNSSGTKSSGKSLDSGTDSGIESSGGIPPASPPSAGFPVQQPSQTESTKIKDVSKTKSSDAGFPKESTSGLTTTYLVKPEAEIITLDEEDPFADTGQ